MGKYFFGEFQIGNRYTYCFEGIRDSVARKAISQGFEVKYGVSHTGKPYFEIVDNIEASNLRTTSINMLKDVCPVCLTNKIELGLNSREYIEKYPADYVLTLGTQKIYLCEYHAKQLAEMFIEEWSGKI